MIRSLEQAWQCNTQEIALNYIGKKGKKYANKGSGVPNKIADDLNAFDAESENIDEEREAHLDEEYLKRAQAQSKLKELQNESVSYAKYLLSTEYLPHIGIGEEYMLKKRIFLGYMVNKLLFCHVGLTPISDRDHAAAKRLHTSGMLISSQFYKIFNQFKSKIATSMESDIMKRKSINLSSYINPAIITSGMISALSNNKWSNSAASQGISQQLEDFNFVSKICFLRKFRIPMSNDGVENRAT